jgi:hypothetical protein
MGIISDCLKLKVSQGIKIVTLKLNVTFIQGEGDT